MGSIHWKRFLAGGWGPAAADAAGAFPPWAHALPFVAWLGLMAVLGPAAGWKYALRMAAGLGLLVWARPWRYYAPLKLKNLPLAVGVGVLVLGIWILPELSWCRRWPALQDFYLRWAVLPLGRLPKGYPDPSPYAPEICGWSLALVRLAGSAFVIAVIEEFFWRGFLYRWLIQKNFLKVGLREFDLQPFLIMVALFGFEHRWLVGMAAGAAYGGLVLLTGDLWAAGIAHVVTNFLLGLYVLASGNYTFW